ncbi:MAG: beta-ketoacyl-[acyl-carrier-protein] synthase family protein [Terracidiphilus sp.]
MTDAQKTIVVTGIGAVSPYGPNLSSLQAGMLAGQCALHPATELYPSFQGTVAAVSAWPSHAEGHRYSRTDRLAMAAARDAVAGLDGSGSALRESGIVMASTVAGLSEIDAEISRGPAAWYRQGGLSRAASYPVSRVAASVGEHLGIEGPACAVSVACASGAMAIALGANLLLDQAAPMVLAGGSDALCPFTLSGFNSLQALDTEPCRPFDQNRKGLNIGEGAAVLVLETLANAARRGARILAVLRGWAMTNDAFHPTAPHKDGAGLASCIQRALEMAECGVEEVGYVNAHGTGTPLNDVAEANAYQSAFRGRSRPIPVSSTKSYFGHCLGAAGALEAAITITAMQNSALFPTLRLTDPIESADIDWLRGELRRQPLPVAMSVSAGFGGSNAALVFGSHRI